MSTNESTLDIPQNPVEIPEVGLDRRSRRIGLCIAVIAVVLAINSALGGKSSDDEIVSRVQASNTWAYFQAKRIRSTQLELTRDLLRAGAVPAGNAAALISKYEQNLERYQKESDEISLQAKGLESTAVAAEKKGDYHDAADIFLQISMVLCSVSLIVGQSLFFIGGLTFAGLGAALAAFAWLL